MPGGYQIRREGSLPDDARLPLWVPGDPHRGGGYLGYMRLVRGHCKRYICR